MKELSQLQLEIMNALWKLEFASVADVMEYFGSGKYARTTIATMLTRLEKKGLVECFKKKNVNVYAPKVKKREALSSSLANVVKNFFNGDNSGLVSHLLIEEASNEELEKIEKLIQSLKKSKSGE